MAITYKIKEGDTLSGIAKQYGATVADLATMNNIADPNKIMTGESLSIPNQAPVTPTASGTPAPAQPPASTLPTYSGQAGQTPEEMAKTGANGTPTNQGAPPAQPPQQSGTGNPIDPLTGQQVTPDATVSTEVATTQPNYTGNSIIDFLKTTGQPSDFTSRSQLASQMGISNYRGSSSQNIDLLNKIRSKPTGTATPTTSETNGAATQASPNAGNPNPVQVAPQTASVISQRGFSPEVTQAQAQKSPFNAFVDAYSALYKDMGLSSIKSEYEAITKQYKDLEDKKADEISDINDDPWLSEGVRQKRIQSVENRYESKTANLTGQMKQMESLYERGQEEVKFIAGQAMQASHQQDVLNQQWAIKAMELAQKDAEASEKHSPAYLEYQDAVDSGYKGTFSQYQTEDANRKISIAKAGANGLTPYQGVQVFDSIVGKYNASPLIQAADRTPVLKDSINAIRKDPNNAALQLNLSYAYIQALDTYQSAVREGELSLVNSIDSKIGQLGNSVQQIQNGQIVRSDVALQIATAAEGIVNTINSAAKSKANSFQSQADVAGVGDKFKQFTGGFSPSYDQQITPQAPSFIPDSEISKYEGQNQSPYTPATIPPLQTNPKGFFDQFLSVFAGN